MRLNELADNQGSTKKTVRALVVVSVLAKARQVAAVLKVKSHAQACL